MEEAMIWRAAMVWVESEGEEGEIEENKSAIDENKHELSSGTTCVAIDRLYQHLETLLDDSIKSRPT